MSDAASCAATECCVVLYAGASARGGICAPVPVWSLAGTALGGFYERRAMCGIVIAEANAWLWAPAGTDPENPQAEVLPLSEGTGRRAGTSPTSHAPHRRRRPQRRRRPGRQYLSARRQQQRRRRRSRTF